VNKRLTIFALVAGLIVAADQATKYLVLTYVPFGSGIEIIPGYLNLVHVRNTGAAWGIAAGPKWGFSSIVLLSISVVVLAAILAAVIFFRPDPGSGLVGYACFFGGALGNLIDRARFGEVIDFVDVHAGDLHWPAFNVADSALCVGAGLFLIQFLRQAKKP
jgi:signal peptidase II